MKDISLLFRRFREHNPFYAEIGSGLSAFGWGVFMTLSTRSLDEIPVYDPITKYIPDEFWVTWAIAGGLAQITFALMEYRHSRLVVGFFMMLFWKILCVSIFRSPEPSPGAMPDCGWALINLATVIRLGFF